ncbi:MAG: glycine cleavage system aminomethyltransferase GcvT [Anaerolineales bacterium]|nr:glycine cleavage system aminomethyltransferase GcvT [Anaerolineales bacterium]MCB9128601.1 glycine cleavage system aminomethyltransferase GcvT [Ardenticatenales bacterium]MCB9172539.1 glycine cleavage system aminomethyltransferase GcvT [Ardenticatenales bacterium]
MADLRRTPLYDQHLALGARMVDFGGWEMPVQYRGIMDEHNAVRTHVGLFDVSHMGEFEVRGPRLVEFLDKLCANDAKKLAVGQAQYTMLLNDAGGTIDDLIVYRVADDRALMVVNAGNIDKDWAQVSAVASSFEGVRVENQSDAWALLALQGPDAESLLDQLIDFDPREMGYYTVREGQIDGLPIIVARTGYTGEDGFELFVPGDQAAQMWQRVMAAGESYAIQPAGLGARDTLRLEASMPLYGHELDDETSPLEAGLGYFVAKEGDYVGAARQRQLRAEGLPRKLVMLKLLGRGIAREGYAVQDGDGVAIGRVTSGSMAPTLGYAIAQAMVEPRHATVGERLFVVIRGKPVEAEIVKRPFYKRAAS